MTILSLDLEMNQPSQTIIERGAVVGDITTQTILERFSVFINPHEILRSDIIALTSITQQDVENGSSLFNGYMQLRALHEKHQCETNPLTWGGGDSLLLKDSLMSLSEFNVTMWPFGRRWLDVKTVFQTYQIANGMKHQAGLAKALTKMNLKFIGKKHRAVDDAANTSLLYCMLLKRLKHT